MHGKLFQLFRDGRWSSWAIFHGVVASEGANCRRQITGSNIVGGKCGALVAGDLQRGHLATAVLTAGHYRKISTGRKGLQLPLTTEDACQERTILCSRCKNQKKTDFLKLILSFLYLLFILFYEEIMQRNVQSLTIVKLAQI